MRTVRCSGRLCLPGGCLFRGLSAWGGVSAQVVSAQEECLHGGSAQLHAWIHPPQWTEWQTGVKTLPCRNYVADSKKFGYNENPLLTSSFFCIFLLIVSGTHCTWNYSSPSVCSHERSRGRSPHVPFTYYHYQASFTRSVNVNVFVCGWIVYWNHKYGWQAGGTHPAGMLSC